MRVFVRFALIAFASLHAGAGHAEDFYRGKTLEVLAGFSPGGGYDAYARALAAVIGKYLPGRPATVVRNMAGAGSLRLATYLQEAGPRDGLSIGIFDNGLQFASLIKPETVRLDPPKLTWIGSVAHDEQVCMTWSAFGAKRAGDLRDREAIFGVTGLDDIRYMNTALMRSVVGGKIKIVPGYPGSSDIRMAVEKRELDGVCDSWQSMKATNPAWIADKKADLLVQMALDSSPELPDVPLVVSFAKPEDKGALGILLAAASSGRAFAAPPGVPADRVALLRAAFNASMKDPEFLAFAKQANLEVDPLPGDVIAASITKVYAAAPADVARAKELVK